MRIPRLPLLLAALAIVGVWLLSPLTPHANADGGTITTTNTTLTYTHGPFFVPNPTDQVGPPQCGTATPCDDYALNVNVPSGTNATDQIQIQFAWDQSIDSETDFDLWVYDANGNVIASNVNGVSPATVTIPAVSGSYTVRADPWNPGGETYTGTISLVPLSSSGTPSDAATVYTGTAPRFQDYALPKTQWGNNEGEPSIGADWKTGKVMYLSGLQTLQVGFDDSTSPATATWKDVSSPITSTVSLDPILVTDHQTGRTFASQLTGQDSLTAFSDNDGGSWTPSQGGGIPSGVDHQTIGVGPYSSSLPDPNTGATGFNKAVYYCSQDIAASFCARSDDGGLTFGPGVATWNMTQCAGIHGHVKIAPDGTVYVPIRQCGSHQAVAVSTDDGTTWTVRPIPDSTVAVGNDPSVGIGSDGTIYVGYQGSDGHARIAVSHDRGVTWSKSVDVGAQVGVQNIVFPAVVAGDGSRAAFAFLGTTTGGDFQSQPSFNGVWYVYIATTYDGGNSWVTVNATPNDPVQRGSVCIAGTTCSNTPNDRNLLDFIDATIDSTGHVLVAYADGCIDACADGTATYDPSNTKQSQQSQMNSFTAVPSIARQSGGETLFSAYDTKQPAVPARPKLTATETSTSGPVQLSWQPPDNGGSAITDYTLYRGTSPGNEHKYADVGTHLSYQDRKIKAGTTYYYELVAKNAVGSSQPSPEVTPQLVTAKPMCSSPGQLALSDPTGDQTGAPANTDLDIQSLSVEEPANTNDLVFNLQVADLSSPGPNHQWRVFWNNPDGTRTYVGMDTDATGAPSFVYGTIDATGGVVDSVNTGLPGSGYTPDGMITVVVPKSDVGSPATGSSLSSLQARTFAAQGDYDVYETATAIDSTGYGTYTLVGNAYCQ
ncbi:MAG TPA: fibronectin type III domain-containing protein [Chloroflexota bacterium]|nr:fibronectin type III domain-containing protein [Chloroflexota bacterium]